MSIRQILLALIAFLVVLLVWSGGLFKYLYDRNNLYVNLQTEKSAELAELVHMQRVCTSLRTTSLAWSVTRRATQRDKYQTAKKECTQSLEKISLSASEIKENIASLNSDIAKYSSMMEQIQGDMGGDNRNAAIAVFQKELEPLAEKIDLDTNSLYTKLALISDKSVKNISNNGSFSLSLMAMTLGVALLLTSGVVLYVSRTITQRVAQAIQLSSALASGDLRHHFPVERKDEIGQLFISLEQVRQAWIMVIGELQTAVANVAEAANIIFSENTQLHEQTSITSNSLQNAASHLSELTLAITQSAQTARQASTLAETTMQSAHKGDIRFRV